MLRILANILRNIELIEDNRMQVEFNDDFGGENNENAYHYSKSNQFLCWP